MHEKKKTTVASFGQDGLVIVWKDCRVQRALRSNLANAALLSAQGVVPTSGISSSGGGGLPDLRFGSGVAAPPIAASSIPNYILEFAKSLRDEKKLTIEQIVEQLQDQGHSQSIIEAVKGSLV